MLFSRALTSASAGLLLSLVDHAIASLTGTSPKAPKLQLLYRLNLTLGDALSFGPGPKGTRLSFPITGGEFNGPRLSGRSSAHLVTTQPWVDRELTRSYRQGSERGGRLGPG